jgi:methylthioribose-1-phosphate isomerase
MELAMNDYYSLQWKNDHLVMIDQRILPAEIEYLDYYDYRKIAEAITTMIVRGAPAIGAAAAYGMALAALEVKTGSVEEMLAALDQAAEILIQARPTAVNLSWAVRRVQTKAHLPVYRDRDAIRQAVIDEAEAIFREDLAANVQIGLNGLAVVPQNARVIHHCNTGALATTGYGTALGVIRTAHEHGKNISVYVDETRPRLQGARLTSWELTQLGIPHKIIVDGAAAHVMRTKGIDLCLVGCDRVAANGDTANKIGTFHLSLAAYALGVRFYIVGPTSTIDMNIPDGDHIPVEERCAEEITQIEGKNIAPAGAEVFNPAFDVTPSRYITGIITEKGIVYPPFRQNLAKLFSE